MNEQTEKNIGQSQHGLREIFKRLSRAPLAMIGLAIVVVLVFTAVFADYIAPFGYADQDLMAAFEEPSKAHLFGTDEFGRDIFSRIIYGSRISLQVGFIAVGIAVFAGGFLGAIAGYYGGKADNLIMRAMDVLLSIPSILLAIAIAASLGPGLFNLMIAVGISSTPNYARIVRGSVLSIRNQEFVEAAKAVGSSDLRIILKHIIPNCLAPIIVQATLGVAIAILTAAGLSFIGLGVRPPTPEWGIMVADGANYIQSGEWWVALFPGLALMLAVFCFNLLGDGLRDLIDPRRRT